MRTAHWMVIGMDFNAYLKMAGMLGYCCSATTEMFPACEAGLIEAAREKSTPPEE